METAKIKCPKCNHEQDIEIPEGKCLHMYKCDACGEISHAEKECCVICEYSDKKCPVHV